jgi:lipopolysaccharide export system protein LptA
MPQNRSRPSKPQRSDGLAAALYAGSPVERIGITLGTGLILFVLFLVYREAVRGLRAPSGRVSRRVARPPDEAAYHLAAEDQGQTNDDQGTRKARKYLANTWVPGASHCIETSDGHTFCYFQEWTQESSHVIKFTPFAMISSRKGDKPDDPPYTVTSDKAYVTFKDEVGPAGKNPGPIVRAGLEGAVEICGPNNLKIRGRNFFFEREEMRIYSDNLVTIQADKHTAIAKGIQIELIAEQKARSDEALAVSGISSVKLLQNVEMTLISAGNAQGSSAPLPGLTKTADKGPQVVRTHCDGSFVFYVESRIATFERNVRIRRETSPGKFDALFSDENVEVAFETKTPAAAKQPGDPKKPTAEKGGPKNATPAVASAANKKPAAGSASSTLQGPGGLDPNLTFKSIHAQGKVVELTSDMNGMRSQMRDFTYDQTAREAKLAWIPRDSDRAERTIRDKTGQVRKAPAAANCVWVGQHGNLLRAQRIQLNHDPQGEVTHVMCLGEGEMQHVEDKTGQVDLAAYWHKEMRKYPDPKSPAFDLIHLEEALIEQPKDGAGIAANFIRLWVTRQSRNAQAVRANLPSTAKQTQAGPHLDHMLAWQKVAMVSSQIECDTDHLEIWFENGPVAPRVSPAERPRQRASLVPTSERVARGTAVPAGDNFMVADATPNNTVRPVPSAPRPAGKRNPNDLLSSTGGSGDPYNLTAAWVRVHVIQGPEGQQPQVADVLAKDNVQLTQAHGESAEPLVVNGNVLEVQNRGEMDQELIVLGQPAHVRDRGAHIEGGRIRFNRLRNTADVDGPGRLQLPVQQMNATAGSDEVARTNNGEPAQPLDVTWQQKMHFDGKTAHFFVNVHTSMTDAQSQSQIRCLNMDVTLTKPFSFSQQQPGDKPTSEADRPAVETVFCQGDVEFESQSTQNDRLAEVRRGQFMDLVFHKLTGKSTANGPGLLRVWRRNENGQSGLAQFSNVRSNAPPKTRKATAWTFQQVKFSGLMEGDFSDLMAGRSRSKVKTAPKVQTASATSSILATNGAWMTVFHDHVEVIYGPVDQPMELVSRDELSEEAGCLLCEFLQATQHPQAGSDPQHIEMLARGNAQIEGKTFRGESDTITYDGSKTQYVLVGDSAGPARLWRQLKIGADPGTNSANRIYFNPITHIVKEDGTSTLDMHQGP